MKTCHKCGGEILWKGLCRSCYHKARYEAKREKLGIKMRYMKRGGTCAKCHVSPVTARGLCRKCYKTKWEKDRKRGRLADQA